MDNLKSSSYRANKNVQLSNLATFENFGQTDKELKKQLRFKVIYITSYSNKEITQKASSHKLTNYILKPYQEKQIEVSITLALEETNRQNKKWEELNLNELSPKEIEVLQYICKGIQTKEIAKKMFNQNLI